MSIINFEARVVLFLYGVLVHWLFLRTFVFLEYTAGASRGFVDQPLTQVSFVLLGGIYVAWLLVPILQLPQEGMKRGVTALALRAAGRAVLASVLALESFYIVASVFLALRLAVHGAINPIEGSILFFIEIQTYGMIGLCLSLPFAVIYGALVPFFKIILARGPRNDSQ